MSDNPRRWFQIHLSTAIVLMFAAGGLLWLNCRKVYYDEGWYSQGWPVPFSYPGPIQENLSYSIGPFEPVFLGVDILFCVLILVICAFAIEARMQRKPILWIVGCCIVFTLLAWVIFIPLVSLLQPWIGHRHPK